MNTPFAFSFSFIITTPEPPPPLAAAGAALFPGCVEAPPPLPELLTPESAIPFGSPPFLPCPPPPKPP